MKSKHPLILIIRDGWGYSPKTKGNIIALADTPNEDRYQREYPHGLLAASGEAVGLDAGFQGNSEVGHLTLGSGRVVFQSLTRINKEIASGNFFKNQAFLEAIEHCRKQKTRLHLLGLLQTEGVHSHLNHLFALLDLCAKKRFHNVDLHLITDGRDAPVIGSLKQLTSLEKKLKALGFGRIVTISGRYYAMDRDNRFERTAVAYKTIALGQGPEFAKPRLYLKSSHAAGVTDEFIVPAHIAGYGGLQPGDGLIFFNFRTDRPRQLTQALIEKKFSGFPRRLIPLHFVALTQYYQPLSGAVAYPNISMANLLGEVVAAAGLKQLRLSETEKYAHVTFFFNGQKEKANKGEDRVLIPSPKVATYDLKPQMSAGEIAARLVAEIKRKKYDLIVTNLVNCDMVGHTGKEQPIRQAVEAVDAAQGKIVTAGLAAGYSCLLLADHGNAEMKSGQTMTSHTTNPVPVILVTEDPGLKKRRFVKGAGLKDVAPAILEILGLKIPKEMGKNNLLT